jgi:DNA-binding GntR family transcriptional regulator
MDPVSPARLSRRSGGPRRTARQGTGGQGRAAAQRPPTASGRSTEDHVHAILREEIEHGLAPGTPLRLSVIAERLGVSTMPVRAALKRLEGDGLVRVMARRGTVVAPLELDDIEEIQAIRWGIEGLAARAGAEAMTEETVAQMRGHLERIRAAAAAHDTDTYLQATYDLEDTCYGAAGRPRLLETVRHYRRAALRYVRAVVGVQGALEVAPAQRFFDAAVARDGARTEALIQEQIVRLFEMIADRMAAAP